MRHEPLKDERPFAPFWCAWWATLGVLGLVLSVHFRNPFPLAVVASAVSLWPAVFRVRR